MSRAVPRTEPLAMKSVVTPIGEAGGSRVCADVVVVPVLRAGLGILAPRTGLIDSALTRPV